MKYYYLLPCLALIIGISACNKDGGEGDDFNTTENFYRTVSTIEVEVAYEPNAEPYTTLNADNLWVFTQNNIEALFDGRALDVSVTVPPNLAAMNAIPDQNKSSYTARQILDLADMYRLGVNTENSGNLWVVFLDGYFQDGDTIRDNVLGVNISGTSVTAVFKPVITNLTALNNQKRFIEQSTVVHELGHALGLVNAGVPLTSSHHDSDHGAHCTNEDCVMYWLNEGAGNLTNFIGVGGMNQTTIIFGPECLQDTRSFNP